MTRHIITAVLMLALIGVNLIEIKENGFKLDKLTIILLAVNIIIYSHEQYKNSLI